ncbi:LysR family transcriptional regulator [Actinocrispum wychmicini]|uniref:LysR family transcriptional regulator n=1 Tax=Actinocrispum wychmicini TaxID=1213861 RepID=UPI001404B431|nr:LysR family transcriptional regulator [Actinocrispum wychmicini]
MNTTRPHQLRTFVVVAEERHFTRAAARLRIAQPAVSQHIRKLERLLGQPLFERNARSVRLTRAGEMFLPHAQAALRAVEIGYAEVAAVSGGLRGALHVGVVDAVEPLGVPSLLARFHRRHPDVTLSVRQAGSEDLLELVRSGTIDVAFLSFGDTATSPGVAVRWLQSSERVVVVVPPDHALAERGELRFADIAQEALVTLREGTGNRSMVDRAFTDLGTHPRIVCDVSGIADVIDLVAEGIGICLLPESVAANAKRRIVAIPLVDPVMWRHLGLVWRSPEAVSSLARAFVSFTESL